MASKLNKLRNADFSAGRRSPTGWNWCAQDSQAFWRRPGPSSVLSETNTPLLEEYAPGSGILVESAGSTAGATWTQTVSCKPGEFYRVEAVVRCRLETPSRFESQGVKDASSLSNRSGFVIELHSIDKNGSLREVLSTPPIRRATEPLELLGYFQAPEGVRRVQVRVGIVNASGWARIETVRFIPILAPDEGSHVLAVPPPATALPVACERREVGVCSQAGLARPLAKELAGLLGKDRVHVILPDCFNPAAATEDALFLPDPVPPPGLRSLKALVRLASSRVVVISLPGFAKLTGGTLSVRRVVQLDDPIHAKLTFADEFTTGFALNDAFPFACRTPDGQGFVQNHFRKNRKFDSFCGRHGFVTLLTSLCSYERTTGRPVGLYKPSPGGGLFVLDVEPVETPVSTQLEFVPAMHLLLSILGQSRCHLGQYVVPARTEVDFRELIREMSWRFPYWHVHDDDLPSAQVTQQLVTVGGQEQSFGLTLKPKPVILMRTGLIPGDHEGVYGAFLWFKQLVRPPPHVCPYAEALGTRFRLAWIPCVSAWEGQRGLRQNAAIAAAPYSLEAEAGTIGALIDIVGRPIQRARVLFPTANKPYEHFATWLSGLHAAFPPGNSCVFTSPEGVEFDNRDTFGWRRMAQPVDVCVDPAGFTEDIHRDVLAAGGRVLRIEIPGSPLDFPAQSIARTDLAATLLEQTVGLLYGLIAVNRGTFTVHFDGFEPVPPGGTLLHHHDETALRALGVRAG